MSQNSELTNFLTARDALIAKRAALVQELAEIDKTLNEEGIDLTGTEVGNGRRKPGRKPGALKPGPKPGRKKGVAKAKKGFGEVPDKGTLKDLLKKAPENRMNRKALNGAGYSLKSAVLIAKENPDDFSFKQNKAQGEVWLKK